MLLCFVLLLAGRSTEARPAPAPLTPLPTPTASQPTTQPPVEATKQKVQSTPSSAPTAKVTTSPAPLPDPLAELERFEARAFRRPGEARRIPPPVVSSPRDSSDDPPVPLRTPELGTTAEARPAPPPGHAWVARLALPDLPIRWDAKLLSYLRFYRHHRQGRAIMRTWLRRMGRYRRMISAELRRQKLPRALIYVAMIESGYDPSRTSRAGAAGLWQFMPRTGRGFGLQRDYWVDERRDPQRATVAAARYLKNLYARFNSWELTLAAYNAGFGAVLHAVQKYNTNDYWQLCRYEAGLPWSTTLYTPKILAAAIVGENRAFFGFDKVVEEPARSSELAAVPRSLSLARIASAAGVELATVRALNPELRRGRTPPRKQTWVRLPVGTATRFYAGLARLGALRYRPYRVHLGDTDSAIAQRHGISTRTLRRINGVQNAAELRPGVLILVPAQSGKVAARRVESDAARKPILVAVPKGAPRRLRGRRRVFYRVALGDTLEEIAQHLGVTVAELGQWNVLDTKAKLISRMILQAFVPRAQDLAQVRLLAPKDVRVVIAGSSTFLDRHEQRKGRRRLTYKVRRGDTLTRIARRFRLSVGSLMRINNFGPSKRLRSGQSIVIYAKGRKAKGRKARRAKRAEGRRAAKLAATKKTKVAQKTKVTQKTKTTKKTKVTQKTKKRGAKQRRGKKTRAIR